MIRAPEDYLNNIIQKNGNTKDISQLIQYFILKCDNDLHFIIDENELNLNSIICNVSRKLSCSNNNFNFKIGQRVISFLYQHDVYSISSIKDKIILKDDSPQHSLVTISNLDNYIPLTNSLIQRSGTIQNRISQFKKNYDADKQCDFFSNEKLLIIGNRNLFVSIPHEFPSCYTTKNHNEAIEIEYNSPLLPKISILKNINLLEDYLQNEINGEQVIFNNCLFIGSSKFENSINIIRNYYNKRLFKRIIFIGDKDFKIDLGNNQNPLRWKWTIPEIKYFKNENIIQHTPILIQNEELEIAIADFYQAIKKIESTHTIGLKSIYKFIRRLYYDWNLKLETTLSKLQKIQEEFNIFLRQLLIETLGNIFPDFDFDVYLIPLSEKYANIVKAISTNNKSEKLISYRKQIHELILPSFLCNTNKLELDEIIRKSKRHITTYGIKDITQMKDELSEHLKDCNRNYCSLAANGIKTNIVSFSKSNDLDTMQHKIISSIYGSGKVEKLIERLLNAKTEYNLLLYSIEEKAMKLHIEFYVSNINKEYISQDRLKISGIEFRDSYYQFSNYDELIAALASTKNEQRETDYYKITFYDNSKVKLPSTKTVLKITKGEKYLVSVEDLSIKDTVLIYANPDKKILRDIMELKNPELIKKADEYSSLWRNSLCNAYKNNIYSETLYQQLIRNHFSVSEHTFKRYLDGEVMFPRSFSDLIVIAKTINDPSLSFNFLKNTIKPKIEEYRGMEIEYGFKFSNSINQFIISNEVDEFISEFLTLTEIEKIKSHIPEKTIKNIEIINQNNDD